MFIFKKRTWLGALAPALMLVLVSACGTSTCDEAGGVFCAGGATTGGGTGGGTGGDTGGDTGGNVCTPTEGGSAADCADGRDNDCDGLVDAEDPDCESYYLDHDGDGDCRYGTDLNGDGDCLDPGEPIVVPPDGSNGGGSNGGGSNGGGSSGGGSNGGGSNGGGSNGGGSNGGGSSGGGSNGGGSNGGGGDPVVDCDESTRWRSSRFDEICDDIEDNDCDPSTTAVCPGGDDQCYLRFRQVAGEEHSAYLICNGGRPWRDARRSCEQWGMRLVRLDNREEDAWLYTTATTAHLTCEGWLAATGKTLSCPKTGGTCCEPVEESYWIGANDEEQEGRWITEAGFTVPSTELPYTHWRSDDPSPDREENCVNVIVGRGNADEGHMQQDECNEDYHTFVCERF